MRYFIHLAFDGSDYRGWQRQKDNPDTIQEVVENTLSKILKKKISVYGCGRTDAGVHSSQYVVQFYTEEAPNFNVRFRLNKNLPKNIAVFEVLEVGEDEHCRNDAVSRTYDYFIHLQKDPFLIRFSSFYGDLQLDFDIMKEAAGLILATKDFKNLCKQPDNYNHTRCEIYNCQLFVNRTDGRLRFTITANRFLRGMVRICVFFLLEVGSGNMTLETFRKILNQEKEVDEIRPAHPNGLFLSGIEYPFLELSNSHSLIRMLKVRLQ